jgi:hypothetical protein
MYPAFLPLELLSYPLKVGLVNVQILSLYPLPLPVNNER